MDWQEEELLKKDIDNYLRIVKGAIERSFSQVSVSEPIVWEFKIRTLEKGSKPIVGVAWEFNLKGLEKEKYHYAIKLNDKISEVKNRFSADNELDDDNITNFTLDDNPRRSKLRDIPDFSLNSPFTVNKNDIPFLSPTSDSASRFSTAYKKINNLPNLYNNFLGKLEMLIVLAVCGSFIGGLFGTLYSAVFGAVFGVSIGLTFGWFFNWKSEIKN